MITMHVLVHSNSLNNSQDPPALCIPSASGAPMQTLGSLRDLQIADPVNQAALSVVPLPSLISTALLLFNHK